MSDEVAKYRESDLDGIAAEAVRGYDVDAAGYLVPVKRSIELSNDPHTDRLYGKEPA